MEEKSSCILPSHLSSKISLEVQRSLHGLEGQYINQFVKARWVTCNVGWHCCTAIPTHWYQYSCMLKCQPSEVRPRERTGVHCVETDQEATMATESELRLKPKPTREARCYYCGAREERWCESPFLVSVSWNMSLLTGAIIGSRGSITPLLLYIHGQAQRLPELVQQCVGHSCPLETSKQVRSAATAILGAQRLSHLHIPDWRDHTATAYTEESSESKHPS